MNNNIDGLRISNEEINKVTRESIQEALVYLLGTKSLESITITEIVDKAGVSRTAYYRNYKSKEEILKDFSSNIFELIFKTLFNEKKYDNPYDCFLYFFSKLKENSRMLKLLVKANQIKLMNLEFNKEKVSYTKAEKYQVEALENGIIAIINMWVRNDFDLNAEEISRICIETFPNAYLLLKN